MSECGDHRQILVVGAGPAGLYASRKLVENGARVVMLNRDIKPGGLAEYGIYFEKYRIKDGLRNQFRQILALPEVDYFGNVMVGNHGDVTFDELRSFGFDAILVAAGAQGTKKLGLPGEDLKSVYHAKDIVYHYNQLPPYSTQKYDVKGRVAIVGVGNVMMDIAHWAARTLKVDEIVAVARRGPAEVKFTVKEMEFVFANLDLPALDAEMERCAPFMNEVGQDPQKAREFILSGAPNALEAVSETKMRFSFLSSPTQLLGNEKGEVTGIEIEDTKLVLKGEDTKAVGLGTRRVLDVDSVVFCIGDTVDAEFGLPAQNGEFVMNPNPVHPVGGVSYEAFDPVKNQPVEGVFTVGWARLSSYGLVGLARRDAENGAGALLEYLKSKPINGQTDVAKRLEEHLRSTGKRLVSKTDILRLEAAEAEQKQKLGVEDFKFATNEEMLKIIE